MCRYVGEVVAFLLAFAFVFYGYLLHVMVFYVLRVLVHLDLWFGFAFGVCYFSDSFLWVVGHCDVFVCMLCF